MVLGMSYTACIFADVINTSSAILSWLHCNYLRGTFPIGNQFGMDLARLMLPNKITRFEGRELLFLVILILLLLFFPLHLPHYPLHGLGVLGIEVVDVFLDGSFGVGLRDDAIQWNVGMKAVEQIVGRLLCG